MTQPLYVITGATGHIGGRLAGHLLDKRQRVRVVGRSAARLQAAATRGAETAVGSVEDPAFVTRAFAGATAAFLMIPPNYQAPDHHAYQQCVTDAYTAALRSGSVSHAVALSSIGAHLHERTGPILGLRHLELALDGLPRLHTVHLRPTYFMENHLIALGGLHQRGAYFSPMRSDLRMPQIASRDVADAAANLLLDVNFTGKTTRELLGQRDLTMAEIIGILGRAIGRPDALYTRVPYEAAEQAMVQMGMSANAAGLMVEMVRGFNEGYITALEPRSSANTTPTSIETFAREDFATAWAAAN